MILVNSTYFASIIVFILGLVLKLFRTPFHTIVLLVALAGLLIAGILYLISNIRERSFLSLLGVGLGTSLLALLKFWPPSVIGAFLLLGLLMIYLIFKNKLSFKSNYAVFPGILVLLLMVFGLMSKSTRYYVTSIHFNTHIEKDYYVWDKYAWFLNVDGHFDEALEALKSAEHIVQETKNEDFIKIIEHQKHLLLQGQWTKFRE